MNGEAIIFFCRLVWYLADEDHDDVDGEGDGEGKREELLTEIIRLKQRQRKRQIRSVPFAAFQGFYYNQNHLFGPVEGLEREVLQARRESELRDKILVGETEIEKFHGFFFPWGSFL